MKTGLAITVMAGALAGCATQANYASPAPDASRTGKVDVTTRGYLGVVALFEHSEQCTGMQTLVNYESINHKIVYVPHGQYLTFVATATKTNAFPTVGLAEAIYSVPFESGELRITISSDNNRMSTLIERREAGSEWVIVNDAVVREYLHPFHMSMPWCSPLASKAGESKIS